MVDKQYLIWQVIYNKTQLTKRQSENVRAVLPNYSKYFENSSLAL